MTKPIVTDGSVEKHRYRGRPIEVWQTHEDHHRPVGRYRPVSRRWHYVADGLTNRSDFPTRESAVHNACLHLDLELDGILRLSGPRYELDSDDNLLDLADVSRPAALDRKSKLREWLLSATETRGFSPAEAATAREKLAEFDN